MKRIKMIVTLVILALVVLSVWHAISTHSRADASIAQEPRMISVTVAGVQPREFQNKIKAVGTLTAHETALVSPKVPGNVEAILVDIGDHVEAGQVLVRLDKTSFRLALDGARATLATAQATVSQARGIQEHALKEYDRAKRLLAENVIPQSRFDAAEAAYKTATQAHKASLGQRKLARTALQSAQEHLDDADISSPISGDVVDRKVEVGVATAPGAMLFRIVDQSSLKVDIALPEKAFDLVHAGTPAELMIDVFEGRSFSGHVLVVNPMVSPATRTFLARIEVPNAEGALVNGMFARVELLANKRQNLAVDRDALQHLSGSGTSYVFVVSQGKAFKKPVVTGVIGEEYAEITGGLVLGDQVVTSGMGNVQAGSRVAIAIQTDQDLDTQQKEKQQ